MDCSSIFAFIIMIPPCVCLLSSFSCCFFALGQFCIFSFAVHQNGRSISYLFNLCIQAIRQQPYTYTKNRCWNSTLRMSIKMNFFGTEHEWIFVFYGILSNKSQKVMYVCLAQCLHLNRMPSHAFSLLSCVLLVAPLICPTGAIAFNSIALVFCCCYFVVVVVSLFRPKVVSSVEKNKE